MNNFPVKTVKPIDRPNFRPEQQEAQFWYEAYFDQHQQLEHTQQELEALKQELKEIKETLRKLSECGNKNCSQPLGQDIYQQKSQPQNFINPSQGEKCGPQYSHANTTRNGCATIDRRIELTLDYCPECEAALERVTNTPVKRHQMAESVSQSVEVWEYERPVYECPACGWRGCAPGKIRLRM
ncbi:MAG: hypothetical protein F6K19_36260 [Cyanothece sp. SIO1E1]|nr:hypothetical protein [Cyanothece sp. SIO1E1]